LSEKKKLIDELKSFENLETRDQDVMQKLDEFMLLLDKSALNSNAIKDLKNKVNTAMDKKLSGQDLLNDVKQLAASEMDKLDQLDKLETLLKNNHFDSRNVKRLSFKATIYTGIKVVIGLLFVTLGFAMIIMQAPPYFEMFTIFHFTRDDGVTLMDLISLIIVAVGIYIIIKSIFNPATNE
jgi:hypothetical protein